MTSTQIATTDPQEQALARIRDVDQRDEQQIVSLLGGELVHEYVYEFKDGSGRVQRGLSWAGIREYAQFRGNFRIEKPEMEDLGDAYRVMVQATDLDRNVTLWAGTHQPKSIRRKDGGVVQDDFAYEKAISKAQRNVIKNLMPMTVVAKVIDQMTGGQSLNRPPGNGRPAKAVRAPESKPESFEGVPKNVGELLTWSNRKYELVRADVLKILGIDDPVLISDLADAWARVQERQESGQAESGDEPEGESEE